MGSVYQRGSIRRIKRTSGDEVWEWRYRHQGKMKQATFSVADFPNEKALWKHLEPSISVINGDSAPVLPSAVTVGMVVDRYIKEYLPDLAKSTRDTDRSMLRLHIWNHWGKTPIISLRPMAIDTWLKGLKMSQSSKGRARRLLKQLIDRAMFWELIPVAINPVTLIRVKGANVLAHCESFSKDI